jgi:hypothetical protein
MMYNYEGDSMALGIGCLPQMDPPKTLERLARDGEYIINVVERGILSDNVRHGKKVSENVMDAVHQYFDSHHLKQVHKYERLFDYLEEGYEKRLRKVGTTSAKNINVKKFIEIALDLIITPDMRLYTHYESTVLGFWSYENLMQRFSLPKSVSSIKTSEQFHEKYFYVVRDAWKNLKSIKPDEKEKISLMRHFNSITGIAESFERNKEDEWSFNKEKDEWERSRRKDILIRQY